MTVRKFGAPQTDNVFVGELAGPLQPIEGRPGRFVLVLMPILPNSNLFDARAATACCFSPSAGGSP